MTYWKQTNRNEQNSKSENSRSNDKKKAKKGKAKKGIWRMPWLSEAMKDVISCEKLRGSANTT